MLPNVIHSVLQTCHIIQSDKVKKKKKKALFFFSQVSPFLATKNGAQTNNSHRCLYQSVCHKTSQQRYINLQQEGNYSTTNLLMNQNYWQTLRDIGHWSNAFNYFCKTTDKFRSVMCVALHDFAISAE